jgi:Zn finger protein HypA/HybF involved in hydrogenase expression
MNFILLNTYNNYIDAHIARGLLEEENINCWLQDENTVTTNPVWNQAVGGIKLMVAEPHAIRAFEILKKLEEEKKLAITCPQCGSHNVEYIVSARKYRNWISALWGFITSTIIMPVDKRQHCFDCGHEFNPEEKP